MEMGDRRDPFDTLLILRVLSQAGASTGAVFSSSVMAK